MKINRMGKLKFSLMALSVLAGASAREAAAASVPDVGASYFVSVGFGTNANGESVPLLFDVYRLPSPTTNNVSFEPFSIQTDGSGKIEGVGLLSIQLDNTGTNFVQLLAEVTGAMGNKGTATTTTLALKLAGHSVNLGLHGAASGSLKFTSTSITALTPGSFTNTYYVATITNISGGTVTNGTPTNVLCGPITNGTLLVLASNAVPGYNGTNYVTQVSSISQSYTSYALHAANGTLAGSISTGLKAKSVSRITYKALPATLADNTVYTQTGTNVSATFGGLSKHSLTINSEVVQIGKKMFLAGGGAGPSAIAAGDITSSTIGSGFIFAGAGAADGKGNFKASIQGLASSRGSGAALVGTTEPALILGFQSTLLTNIGGTNYYAISTNVAVNGIKSITSVKGKAFGQAINATPSAGFGIVPDNTNVPPSHIP
jgi:hypothetical protein